MRPGGHATGAVIKHLQAGQKKRWTLSTQIRANSPLDEEPSARPKEAGIHGLACQAWELSLLDAPSTLGAVSPSVASPQSNDTSEAFIKTLMRDYIRISALPKAATALLLIDR
jgi:hypothetical protein